MGFKERIQRFMQGRYGADGFSRFLSFASLALLVIALIMQAVGVQAAGTALWWVALIMLIYGYYRMLSRNFAARSAENARYLAIKGKVTGFFRREAGHAKQLKTHRFFRCPSCGQRVRTPRGKGRIRIICPKCGTTFIKIS